VSIQAYARAGGALFLVSLVAGGFGEFYAPSQIIVTANATATAHNILASASLFRIGFACYLLEAICDVSLTWVFYVLLRPVHPGLALLAVFFRLVATTTFAFAELFYFAPLLILGGDGYLKAFSADQLNSLALLSLNLYGFGSGLFMVFYGIGALLTGYLMFRSGYLPRILGGLLALGGLGFVIDNVALVLAPTHSTFAFAVPVLLAGVCLTVWLLVKGVDGPRWEESAAAAAQRTLLG
jgi:hypothetical protein